MRKNIRTKATAPVFAELHAAKARAPIVEREDDVTVLHEVLLEEPFVATWISAPRAPHSLHAGSAIHIDYDGITLARLQLARGRA